MSDQGVWFKLWDGWENDGELANLSKEDLLHWVLLGGYLKKHGNNGMTCISKPATALQKKLMLTSYEAVVNVIKKFPNCVIEEKQNQSVTNSVTCDEYIPVILNITWKNWRPYQGDSSRERMRRMRRKGASQYSQKVTIKKRREEKRGEEKIKDLDSSADSRVKTTPASPHPAIHPWLIGLELYEKDERLKRRIWDLDKAWIQTYTAFDIGVEIKKAHNWELSNHKKTKRIAFLTNWLNRAQDRGGTHAAPINRPGNYQGAQPIDGKYDRVLEERQADLERRLRKDP